jgi:hypothetical protein
MWPQTPRQQKKSMTMAMKEAIVTVLYKGGGKNRGTCKSYRPVSVTPIWRYRVMMKAVQLKLHKGRWKRY